MMIPNTEENREKLAKEMISQIQMEMISDLITIYKDDDETFQNDWKEEFGEEEDCE